MIYFNLRGVLFEINYCIGVRPTFMELRVGKRYLIIIFELSAIRGMSNE
jgi:hypothetical protein